MFRNKINAVFICLFLYTSTALGNLFDADQDIEQSVTDNGIGAINTGSGTIITG